MGLGRAWASQMIGGHHRAKGRGERSLGIGQEGRDPGQCLVRVGVEDVEDGADQQRMAGLLPMVAPFQRPFGIDQNIGDILDIADFAGPAADFEQRIVAGRGRVGRIEQQAMGEARAPACAHLPILALDVMDDGRTRPAQKRRNDQTDALAAAGRREDDDMFGAIVAQIILAMTPENEARGFQQSRAGDILPGCPAGSAISRDLAGLTRAP